MNHCDRVYENNAMAVCYAVLCCGVVWWVYVRTLTRFKHVCMYVYVWDTFHKNDHTALRFVQFAWFDYSRWICELDLWNRPQTCLFLCMRMLDIHSKRIFLMTAFSKCVSLRYSTDYSCAASAHFIYWNVCTKNSES